MLSLFGNSYINSMDTQGNETWIADHLQVPTAIVPNTAIEQGQDRSFEMMRNNLTMQVQAMISSIRSLGASHEIITVLTPAGLGRAIIEVFRFNCVEYGILEEDEEMSSFLDRPDEWVDTLEKDEALYIIDLYQSYLLILLGVLQGPSKPEDLKANMDLVRSMIFGYSLDADDKSLMGFFNYAFTGFDFIADLEGIKQKLELIWDFDLD